MSTLSYELPRPRQSFMEHRWGVRVEMRLPVLLEHGHGEVTPASLCNVSISGALIECEKPAPLFAALVVVVPPAEGRPNALRITGRVVRREAGFIALEWQDMACQPLLALLQREGSAIDLFGPDRVFY
jgi:hypothetical protein